jgi:hypothetical protein
MSEDRDQRRDDSDHHGDDDRVPAEDGLQTGLDDHHVDDVEADEGEERADEWHQHAAVAELCARLDHLGQAEHRTLGGMKGHEQRAERDTGKAGHDRPPKGQAQTGADEAERQGERLEVADEPERPLMADLAVAFVVGDVVDGPGLDERRGSAADVGGLGCGSHRTSDGAVAVMRITLRDEPGGGHSKTVQNRHSGWMKCTVLR